MCLFELKKQNKKKNNKLAWNFTIDLFGQYDVEKGSYSEKLGV